MKTQRIENAVMNIINQMEIVENKFNYRGQYNMNDLHGLAKAGRKTVFMYKHYSKALGLEFVNHPYCKNVLSREMRIFFKDHNHWAGSEVYKIYL